PSPAPTGKPPPGRDSPPRPASNQKGEPPMREITVMAAGRRDGGGLVRFGKAHPGDGLAELHAASHTDGTAASVLLTHRAGVLLMAHLGAFITNTPAGLDIHVMDADGWDGKGLVH